MATSLLDYIPEPDYRTPAGAIPHPTTQMTQTDLINPFLPGTNWRADDPARFGIKTKEQADAFNAMIWNQSGGLSGAPMPVAPPPDYRYMPRVVPATLKEPRPTGGVQGFNPFARPNPVVRGVLPGYGPMQPPGSIPTPTPFQFTGGAPQMVKPGMNTTIKNPAQANRLTTNLAQFSGPMAQAKQQSLTDFTQSFIDDRKKQKAAYDQESGFIGSTFDPGGLEAKLAGLSRNRQALGRQAAAQAMTRAGRDANVGRMIGGGNSSYLDRAYADQLGRILLENSMKGADLDRENALYLQGQRNASLGARRGLGVNYVNDAMMPYNTLTEAQGADLGNLGRIANLEDSYSLYDYVSPDEAARRNLGLLGDLETTQRRYAL